MAGKKGTLHDPVRVMRRAIKFASKDFRREALTYIHLDSNGDVASTDSYRLYCELGAWSGPSIEITSDTAQKIAKCKVKGNGSAVIERLENGAARVTMEDGTTFGGDAVQLHMKYPRYKALLDEFETFAMARVSARQLLPIAREHVRMGDKVRLGVKGGSLTADGTDGEPCARFDGCGEGESYAGVDPAYLRDALSIFGECAVRFMNPLRPVMFTDDENVRVLVMPVRMDEKPGREAAKGMRKAPKAPEPESEQGKTAGERKQEERMAKRQEKKEDVDRKELARILYALAIDRAAKDPHNRLTDGHATQGEATRVWRMQKDGSLKREEFGEFTSWYLHGEFVTCIEQRHSKRKIELYYPEIKPVQHKDDLVMKMRTERALAERGAKASVKTGDAGTGITAVVVEQPKAEEKPKKQPPKAPKAPEKKEDKLDKRIEELEAQLKATRKELEEVWKENERLKRQDAPKAGSEAKPAAKSDEGAAEVSLATMQAWCEGKGLKAKQVNEGSSIWILGPSLPYKPELEDMGARWGTSKKFGKGWYIAPSAA